MADNFEDMCEEVTVNPDNVEKAKHQKIDDNDVIRLSEIFKVLGDPTRIRIIHVLSNCEMCVCDIAETLDMTQSAISHQLRLLRAMKIVKFRKEGKSVIYSLDDDHVLQLFSQGMEHISHS